MNMSLLEGATIALPAHNAVFIGEESVTQEEKRLEESRERTAHWKRWGPYLSERAWGTVREDYSPNGDAWGYLPFDHARSKAYRWNEDGIAGICDRHQFVCFALALWNEHDAFLKERMYGLSGKEGNHGEDVKEYYFYLDSTPTHSYMKFVYKYPQSAFPYEALLENNRKRTRQDPEYELLDTGVFNENSYFDVFVEYAKAGVEDILIRVSATNRGPDPAPLHLLPTLWFRNTWTWTGEGPKPQLRALVGRNPPIVEVSHPALSKRLLYCQAAPELLFTENETNNRRLYGTQNTFPYVKDGINDRVVLRTEDAVNPQQVGTKMAAHYLFTLQPGETVVLKLRFCESSQHLEATDVLGDDFDAVFASRIEDAEEFYAKVVPAGLSKDARLVMRQALGSLLWTKQYYGYVVRDWLLGDPAMPPPPAERLQGRNHEWIHLYNADVLSMPDKWEYPWYGAWDLAFHCIPIALVDPDFAKEQLLLLLREWYMHPNGQLPAYEWSFNDVNPPVHAWAAWRVYKIEKKHRGRGDQNFLRRVFQKLLLNFTWWVNRKDAEGDNIFQGGFLGLDNIGVFDRSQPLPNGGLIEQSDGTGWMAMYALNMLAIALELAHDDPSYEDVASKFWEHFVYIAHAMNHRGRNDVEMWNEEDGFYYDVLRFDDGRNFPLKVRSIVGLIPLFAVETLEPAVVDRLPGFKRRLDWFIDNRQDLMCNLASMRTPGQGKRRLLSIVNGERLRRILKVMLDEEEFLSPYGIRALSRFHLAHPYMLQLDGTVHHVDYEPAESTTPFFGGNSNWRGPVWLPLNFLLIESLQRFHRYLGEGYKVECPTGSGRLMTLWEISIDLSRRLTRLFLRAPDGRRAAHGKSERFQFDPHWRDLLLFYEYFHGDDGSGLGASHQTGWTGLVAKLLQQCGA